MAMQYWRNLGEARAKFVVLENSYHGDTVGAMSASARGLFTAAFEPVMFEVVHAASLDDVERALIADNAAAVLIEPMLRGRRHDHVAVTVRTRHPRSLFASWHSDDRGRSVNGSAAPVRCSRANMLA